MFLRFFRSTSGIVLTVILLIGILTWLHGLDATNIDSYRKYGTFLFMLFKVLIAEIHGLDIWISFGLFISIAILLLYTNARLHLLEKFSYLPAFCYVMFIGGVPEIHQFYPSIIAVFLLILSCIFIVKPFESERLSYSYFTAAAIISFAMLFYKYMYMYMLVIWFVIALWRPGYWREWVFSLLGFAFPLFLAFSWFFLVEDNAGYMGVFFSELFDINLHIPAFYLHTIFFFAVSLAMVAVMLWYTMRHIQSKKNTIRTGYYVLALIMAITMLIAVLDPDIFPQAWYILSFPMSFFAACYLDTVKSLRLGNIFLGALFAGVIIAQLVSLFAM